MKKYFLLLTLPLFSFFQSAGQDFRAQFRAVVSQKDTTATSKILHDWEKAKPNDPELYVAYFNFYFKQSMSEAISMETTQRGEKSLEIKDQKTNKVVGYLNDGVTYKKEFVDKSFSYIDMGIGKFPSRLDMRFGKIYALGKVFDYARFTNDIIAAIEYAKKINLYWTWTDGKPVDDPKKFMLSAIQDYVNQLYNAGDEQLPRMKAIAETVLKYYPDHVESLSNLAITYIIKKDYDNALTPLLKAEKIAPTDAIVLNNIAYCYNGKGDKPNAIKYYELTEKYGNADEKAEAKQKLDILRSAH